MAEAVLLEGLEVVGMRYSFGCCVFKPGRADRLDTNGTCRASGFDVFSAQAMVNGRDHPCRHKNCDKLHIPNDLQILRFNLGRDTSYLTIDYPGDDSERSKDAVTFRPRYSSLNQYSLSIIKER